MNENAVIGSNGNTNEVVVEYSNNPYWEGTPDSSKTEPDTVVVFTLQGNGTKVNAADENVKLGGAEFELYSSKIEDDKEVKGDRIYVNATDEEGIYTTTDANDTAIAANTQIVSVEVTGAVSYTHLDVYKRQVLMPGNLKVNGEGSEWNTDSSRILWNFHEGGKPYTGEINARDKDIPCLLYTSRFESGHGRSGQADSPDACGQAD